MSVEQHQPGGLPPWNPHTALILAVTVIAFAAIVVLALAGHGVAAALIGPVWVTSCGVLGFRRSGSA